MSIRIVTDALPAQGEALAERIAGVLAGLRLNNIPPAAVTAAINDLLDFSGLCIAARRSDYIAALLAAGDQEGQCTAFGHAQGLSAAAAALVNGTAAHGEDFDDTLEGAPIRVGAMVIPAVLAAAERHHRSGSDALLGIIAGLEAVCRFNHVVPGAMHRAGFHPVGIIGVLGATAGVGVALGLTPRQLTDAFGIAGSFASGLGEFLSEGAWTKRLHPGWAAQSGYRAALLGKGGFNGPRTVFEGPRNIFRVFGRDAAADYSPLLDRLGRRFMMERIAFKPYACGTMIHPFIDCFLQMRRDGVDPDAIAGVECETGEGLVDRLWEPLAAKQRPATGYAAKFSMPFAMAVAFFEGDAGLEQFSDRHVALPHVLRLAAKIGYVIDAENDYPRNYSGHTRVTFKDGRIQEWRQPHFRGGVKQPLTRRELTAKFRRNIAFGGLSNRYGDALLEYCLTIADQPDLSTLARFRETAEFD